MSGNPLSFDIVIATRNRQAVLPISLRTMLSQSRLPNRLIIVDSSDDHAAVRQIVESAVRESGITVDARVIPSASGITIQRNVGLAHVQSPVVLFPDDDALWFPGVAEAILRIYERDVEGTVGCVAAKDSNVPPPGLLEQTTTPHRMAFRDRFASFILPITRPIASRIFPDPMFPGRYWMNMWGAKKAPNWLVEEEAELCGPVGGYRMSFRTAVIRELGGFDENLGRYSLYEDCDASIGSLRQHINVYAGRARVFHYRVPGARAKGMEFGMMAILNRTYIACKHAPKNSSVPKKLRRFLIYQMARYALQAHNPYGRERLRGAWYGLRNAHLLINASREELSSRYLKITGRVRGQS